MLPAIETHARIAFRHLDPEAQEEAVQEAVCNACRAVARLAELQKLDLAYPSVLAHFAVSQVKDGRKVGCSLNSKRFALRCPRCPAQRQEARRRSRRTTSRV
jgi:hypothetical protein